jgi:ribosomal protein S19
LHKKIGIYNGKVFISLNVTVPFLGYNLGHFCITRIKPPHRGKQKQKKKVQKSIFDKTPVKKIVIERLKKMKKI